MMTEEERKAIAIEWYKLGMQKEQEAACDTFTPFIMYWIAFNCLYNICRNKYEHERIGAYCGKRVKILKRYNAFKQKEIAIFMNGAVYDMWGDDQGKCKMRYQKLVENDEKDKIIALFKTMYQVRCNLFHGSKRIDDNRDKELVKSATVILKGYLEVLLDVKNNSCIGDVEDETTI